ncbi:exported hypothetical protein [Desulfamplus magnetovallimortis]|uniref:LamG-like jellyroll fold domain-containing protein n=1 Tax=Desulfamplus magnetovallimortis TaxID=1246637 RepID=A0A1W1HJA8_9BACT|nr:LamG-like jellyroll fold domain-containing protein [Desulfamplus magnetovallimortis]SLM32559.1 exported hypothetical protein [Desulfamplus magnetovallimortis]
MTKRILIISMALLTLASVAHATNYALNFDGTDDYVDCGSIDLSGSTLTLECWVKLNNFDNPGQGVISLIGTEQDGNFAYLRLGDGGVPLPLNQAQFVINIGGSPQILNGTLALEANKWYHIAGVYDTSSGMKLYINGVLDTSNLLSGTVTSNSSFFIGNNKIGDNRFIDGMMDEVRVWNTARTEAEIKANMYKEITTPNANLKAYYKMSDGSGITLTDNSDNSNPGTITNGATWKASGAFAGPRKALDFDGSNDYVNIPHNAQLSFTNESNYTIEAWIKPRSFNLLGGIVGKYHTQESYGYTLRLTFDSPYSGIRFDDMSTANGILTLDQWHHIAAINSGGTKKVYLNGVEQTLSGIPYTVAANSDPVIIGKDFLAESGTRYFNGEIDEVRIWNVARTDDQIRENMMNTLNGSDANLVAYYRMDQSDGTTLYDMTANANNGTLTNMDQATDWVDSTAFNTWIGSEDNAWATAGNWSRNSAPASTDNVGLYKLSSLANEVVISGTPTVNSLFFSSNATPTLSSDFSVNGNFLLGKDIDMQSRSITLGSSGTLVEGSYNLNASGSGNITTTRDLSNITDENVAGLGTVLTTSANMGSTTITRAHTAQTISGNPSILRYYDINPTTNTGLNATLVFNYNDSELNGLTEADLKLWKSPDGGTNWSISGGTIDTANNTITVTGQDGFSRWGAAVPTPATYNTTISTSSSGGLWSSDGGTDTWTPYATGATVSISEIEDKLNAGTSVVITTGSGAGEPGDINLSGTISKTAGDTATLTLKASRNIVFTDKIAAADRLIRIPGIITSLSNALNVVLNSRYLATLDSETGAVWLPRGSSITTNGGSVTIGGGIDPLSDYAIGTNLIVDENNSIMRGVAINGDIAAGGGNISLIGKGSTAGGVSHARGVNLSGNITTTGAGTVTIKGIGKGGSDGIAVGDTWFTDTGGYLSGAGKVRSENGTTTITGTKGTGSNAININAGSSVKTNGSGNINITSISGNVAGQSGTTTSDGGQIICGGNTTITATSTDNISLLHELNDFTGVLSIPVSSGNVSVLDTNALSLGAISATGTIDIASGVVDTGDLTLTGAMSTDDTSTSPAAIMLNAGKASGAGTATGGNIIVSGGSATVGPGGTALLYTGSVSGSTGVTALSGYVSSYYNSDETSGLSPGVGLYVAYREPAPVTVTKLQEFSTSNSLTDNFTEGTNGSGDPFVWDATAGLGGGGGILVSTSSSDQIWTAKESYNVTEGGVYTLSAYFKMAANSGYGALGFSTETINSASGSVGMPGSGNFLGISFHGGGGNWLNNALGSALSWTGGDMTYSPATWYFFELIVEAKTGNDFDLTFRIKNSDDNGNIGTLHTEHTTTLTNSDIAGASALYVFFSADGSRTGGIDNFEIELTGGVDIFYSVTYEGNGADSGTPPADGNSYAQGDSITVLGNTGTLVKTGYDFAGWNTASDGSGMTYQSGDSFVMGASNMTLYAVWTAVVPDYVLYLNGASGYGVKNSSTGIPSGNSAYSWEMWVNAATTTGQDRKVFSWGVDGINDNSVQVGFNSSGYLVINHWGASNDWTTPYLMPQHSWIHLAGTYNGTTETFYVNGVFQQSRTVSPTLSIPSNSELRVGDLITGTYNQFFHGAIKDLRIWSTALDEATISSWKDQIVTIGHPNYANLVSHYTMNQSSGSTVTDSKGSNSLTIGGITAWTQDIYGISYDSNGATSGAVPGQQTKLHDIALNLATNTGTLAKTGYTFDGWNTAADGSGTDYAEGGSYTDNVSITLYAKWSYSQTVTIGTNSGSNASETFPLIPTTFTNAKVQILITATELSNVGVPSGSDITGIQWYVTSDNTPNEVLFDLYMGHTTKTQLSSDATFEDSSGLTLVGPNMSYSGTYIGWHTADFSSSPFIWNGTDSLLIQTCRTGYAQGASDSIAYSNESGYKMVTGYNHNCSAVSGYYSETTRPYLQLIYSSSVPLLYTVTGTARYWSGSGTVSPDTHTVVASNTTTLTITPGIGSRISTITGCGGTTITGPIAISTFYTTGNITEDCTVTATFTLNSYTVTASAGTGGTISPASRTVNYNDTTTFTIIPDWGYLFNNFTGNCPSGAWSGNTYTSGVITGDCTLNATFTPKTYTVTGHATANGTVSHTNGTSSPATVDVSHGGSATFTVTPDSGYMINYVLGCNGTLAGTTYTTGPITGPCKVMAFFKSQ